MILKKDNQNLTLSSKSLQRIVSYRKKAINCLAVISLARELMSPNLSEDYDIEAEVDTDGIVEAWESFSLKGMTLITTLTPLEEILKCDFEFLRRLRYSD